MEDIIENLINIREEIANEKDDEEKSYLITEEVELEYQLIKNIENKKGCNIPVECRDKIIEDTINGGIIL